MDGHRQGGLSAGGAITCRVCGRLNYSNGPMCTACSQARRGPLPGTAMTPQRPPALPSPGRATVSAGSHGSRVDHRTTTAAASPIVVKPKHSSSSSPSVGRTNDRSAQESWYHSSSGRQTSSTSSSHRHSTPSSSDRSRSLSSPRRAYRSGDRSSSSTSWRSPERRSRSRSRPRSNRSRSRSRSRSRGRKDQQQQSKRSHDDSGMPPRSIYTKHKPLERTKTVSEASRSGAKAAPAVIPTTASAVAPKKRPREEDVIDLISDSEDEDEKLPAVSTIKPAEPADAAAPAKAKTPDTPVIASRKRPLSTAASEKPVSGQSQQSVEVGDAEDSDVSDEDLGAYRGRMFDERVFNVNDFPTGEEYSSAKERSMAAKKPKAARKNGPITGGKPPAPIAEVVPEATAVPDSVSTASSASSNTLAAPASTSVSELEGVQTSVGSAPQPIPVALRAPEKTASSISAPQPSMRSSVVASSPPDRIPSDQTSAPKSMATVPVPGTQASASNKTRPEAADRSTSQVDSAASVPTVKSVPRSRLSLRHPGDCQDQPIELSDDDDQDASSSPSKSVRGVLFQARCFPSIVFNERDFITVRDGIQVARRSSTQSLANPAVAEVTPSSEASASPSDAPAAVAPAHPTNVTTVADPDHQTTLSVVTTTITALEPAIGEPEAGQTAESNAEASVTSAVFSRPPAPQMIGHKTAVQVKSTPPQPRLPKAVNQASSEPSASQVNSNAGQKKTPAVSNHASVSISQTSDSSSWMQSKVRPTKVAIPMPSSAPVPSSVQTTSQASASSSSIQAASTNVGVGLSATVNQSSVSSQHPSSAHTPNNKTPTQHPSAAPAATETAPANVLKPRKKKIEFRYLRKSPNAIPMSNPPLSQGTQATWTTSAGVVQPSKHSFVKMSPPPPLVTVHKPVRLGDCSPEFMQFMKDCCENEDPADEDNEDMVRRMQLQLLEVVDLTSLSDSDDRSDVDDSEFMDESRPTTPTAASSEASTPRVTTAVPMLVTTEPAVGAQRSAVSATDEDNVQTRVEVNLNRRGARPMETCVLCEERRWVKTLQHCAECSMFYHKKCAREYGDENVCWNCELDGIIDDSELTETARNEVLGILSTFRHEPVDESNAESNDVITNEDGRASMDDAESERPAVESSGPHPLLSGAQTRSVQRWKAFLEWSTATYDHAFNETTNAITAELQSEQHKNKYTNGFLTQEEFAASIGSVLDTYAELQERLDREREQVRQQNLLAAVNQSTPSVSSTPEEVIVGNTNSNEQTFQTPAPAESAQAIPDATILSNTPATIPSQTTQPIVSHIPI